MEIIWAEISQENKNVESVNLHENILQAGFFKIEVVPLTI